VRGEYCSAMRGVESNYGSSPRAWGIHNYQGIGSSTSWFIPTCVGNTVTTELHGCCSLVHPHVRGEYTSIYCFLILQKGSSPRAWGIRKDSYVFFILIWFIPTCVGNTELYNIENSKSAVHPHVRGEYTFRDVSQLVHGEFIPTCVGNTP